MCRRYPKAYRQRKNLDQLGKSRILRLLLPLVQSKRRRSKDAYLSGKTIPTHDPCSKIHRSRSGKLPIGKDRRCTTTHREKQLPRLGRSASRSRWKKEQQLL